MAFVNVSKKYKHHAVSRAVEIGLKYLGFKGYLYKNLKYLKIPNLGFRFLRKTFKSPDFRLTVTAENCCLTV